MEVEAQDVSGEVFKIEADVETSGIFAIALQHEFDHLEGRLLIDFLSPLNRALMKRRLKRYKKGADVATLMKKTNFNRRKIYDNVKMLKKQGKIKSAGIGVYVKV